MLEGDAFLQDASPAVRTQFMHSLHAASSIVADESGAPASDAGNPSDAAPESSGTVPVGDQTKQVEELSEEEASAYEQDIADGRRRCARVASRVNYAEGGHLDNNPAAASAHDPDAATDPDAPAAEEEENDDDDMSTEESQPSEPNQMIDPDSMLRYFDTSHEFTHQCLDAPDLFRLDVAALCLEGEAIGCGGVRFASMTIHSHGANQMDLQEEFTLRPGDMLIEMDDTHIDDLRSLRKYLFVGASADFVKPLQRLSHEVYLDLIEVKLVGRKNQPKTWTPVTKKKCKDPQIISLSSIFIGGVIPVEEDSHPELWLMFSTFLCKAAVLRFYREHHAIFLVHASLSFLRNMLHHIPLEILCS